MGHDLDIHKTYAPELRRAREALTVADEVGLALRAHRRELRLSQRAYAQKRGLSRTMLARIEAGAGNLSLATVVDALRGTGYQLFVGHDRGHPTPPHAGAAAAGPPVPADRSHGSPVAATEWEPTDLLARVRGDSRRFPAHREVQAVESPPLWWWMHEFFSGPTEEPKWYAPVCHLHLLKPPTAADTDEPSPGAA